jgi:glucuronoxylan 4-O-methyltransferase
MKWTKAELKKWTKIPTQARTKINALVKINAGQMTQQEYSYIANMILHYQPCNLLIFGLGRDSALWMKCNQGGNTLFLENKKEWIKVAKEKTPGINILKVKYSTRKADWKELLGNDKKLQMKLPAMIQNTVWDIILVDAPAGVTPKQPGRMQSIYTASKLKHRHLLTHDNDRDVESAYSKKYGKKLIFEQDKLRHYKA